MVHARNANYEATVSALTRFSRTSYAQAACANKDADANKSDPKVSESRTGPSSVAKSAITSSQVNDSSISTNKPPETTVTAGEPKSNAVASPPSEKPVVHLQPTKACASAVMMATSGIPKIPAALVPPAPIFGGDVRQSSAGQHSNVVTAAPGGPFPFAPLDCLATLHEGKAGYRMWQAQRVPTASSHGGGYDLGDYTSPQVSGVGASTNMTTIVEKSSVRRAGATTMASESAASAGSSSVRLVHPGQVPPHVTTAGGEQHGGGVYPGAYTAGDFESGPPLHPNMWDGSHFGHTTSLHDGTLPPGAGSRSGFGKPLPHLALAMPSTRILAHLKQPQDTIRSVGSDSADPIARMPHSVTRGPFDWPSSIDIMDTSQTGIQFGAVQYGGGAAARLSPDDSPHPSGGGVPQYRAGGGYAGTGHEQLGPLTGAGSYVRGKPDVGGESSASTDPNRRSTPQHVELGYREKFFHELVEDKDIASPEGKKQASAVVLRRVFQCYTCGKIFKHRSKMIRHSRIHTGEKPFECVECKKRFRQRCHLRVHQQIHTRRRVAQSSDPTLPSESGAAELKYPKARGNKRRKVAAVVSWDDDAMKDGPGTLNEECQDGPDGSRAVPIASDA